MIDHVSVRPSDFEKSKKFYAALLMPLGFKVIRETETLCRFGAEDGSTFGVGKRDFVTMGAHFAIGAPNETAVRESYEAALKAGGKDNGAPGPRDKYGPDYFGTFVFDPDGNNVEIVYRSHWLKY